MVLTLLGCFPFPGVATVAQTQSRDIFVSPTPTILSKSHFLQTCSSGPKEALKISNPYNLCPNP